MLTKIFNIVKFNKLSYVSCNDVMSLAPMFSKKSRNSRSLIKNKKIPEKMYLFAKLDDDGEWIPQVKSINIKMAIGEAPVCVCTMWNGFFKPSNPAIAEFPMKQARSVTAKEFQTMIDELQTDPFAIR